MISTVLRCELSGDISPVATGILARQLVEVLTMVVVAIKVIPPEPQVGAGFLGPGLGQQP